MLSDHAQGEHRPRTGGAPSAAEVRPDARFLAMTDGANRAFADGDEARAGRGYVEALAEAERLLAQAGEQDVAAMLIGPMALTVASANLAEFRKQSGAPAEARALSLSAIERLMAAAACPSRPMTLRLGCLRHLGYAVRFFRDLTGDDGETEALVARIAPVAAEVRRVAFAWQAARVDEPRAFDA